MHQKNRNISAANNAKERSKPDSWEQKRKTSESRPSCRARAHHGLLDLGDLIARANDEVSSVVLDVVDVLVFPLSALPDLDFAAATNDTDSHGGEQVVGSVGMGVDAAVEDGRGVLAETALDHGFSTRVLVDEVGHIVNDTGNRNETATLVDLLDVVVPLNDGKLIERNTPVKLRTLLVELLLKLLNTALFDFVGAELLEVVGEAKLAP